MPNDSGQKTCIAYVNGYSVWNFSYSFVYLIYLDNFLSEIALTLTPLTLSVINLFCDLLVLRISTVVLGKRVL